MIPARVKMPAVTPKTLEYVCRDMLGFGEWRPDWTDHEDLWECLSCCHSLLEVAYLVGAYRTMEGIAEDCYSVPMPPAFGAVIAVKNDVHRGVWFMEPWWGFGAGGGPSALAFVPQYPVGTLHADFGVLVGDDNGSPRWRLQCLVEINGYAVHRKQREQDEQRALRIERDSSVPVLQFFEETDNPFSWIHTVIDHYHGDATG